MIEERFLQGQPVSSLVHPSNQVVDEVLPVAMVATLDVMQPLLIHATLKTRCYIRHAYEGCKPVCKRIVMLGYAL